MIGQPVEYSLWFSGDSQEQKRKAEIIIRSNFFASVWSFAEIYFETLSPGDDRVPEPPEKWWGENPKILLGYSTIIGMPRVGKSLSEDLDDESITAMRAATRRANGYLISDEECDKYIDSLGPEVAAKVLH